MRRFLISPQVIFLIVLMLTILIIAWSDKCNQLVVSGLTQLDYRKATDAMDNSEKRDLSSGIKLPFEEEQLADIRLEAKTNNVEKMNEENKEFVEGFITGFRVCFWGPISGAGWWDYLPTTLVISFLTALFSTLLALYSVYYNIETWFDTPSLIMETVPQIFFLFIFYHLIWDIRNEYFYYLWFPGIAFSYLPVIYRQIKNELLLIKRQRFIDAEKIAGFSDLQIKRFLALDFCLPIILIQSIFILGGILFYDMCMCFLNKFGSVSNPSLGALFVNRYMQRKIQQGLLGYKEIIILITIAVSSFILFNLSKNLQEIRRGRR